METSQAPAMSCTTDSWNQWPRFCYLCIGETVMDQAIWQNWAPEAIEEEQKYILERCSEEDRVTWITRFKEDHKREDGIHLNFILS